MITYEMQTFNFMLTHCPSDICNTPTAGFEADPVISAESGTPNFERFQ